MNIGIEEFIDKHPSSRAVFGRDNSLMFIVDNAKKWHQQNIGLNNEEYYKKSFKGRLKDRRKKSNNNINYGVVDFRDLSRILVNWENITVSSRFLKDPDFLYIPDSSKDLGAYVLDTYLQHNRENAVVVNLLANGTTSISELLCKILGENKKKDTKAYVKENYSSLVNLFKLNTGSDYYMVDYDRVFLSYSFIERYYRVILPKNLVRYYEKKKIDMANRKRVLLATKEYLKQKRQNDKQIFNDSYSDKYVRSSNFTLK